MLLYDYPEYYEVAFSFRNIPDEACFIDACIQQYSLVPVRSIFEVGCGPAPHAGELVKKGYRYVGLDINRTMLDHARYKWRHLDRAVELVEGDMAGFSYDKQVEFVYVMLGSLYLNGATEMTSHFDAISRILKPGGLYFLDWCIQLSDSLSETATNKYAIEKDGIAIVSEFNIQLVDSDRQMYEEIWSVNVDDHGRHKSFVMTERNRAMFPEEFLKFIDNRDDFELVGWWRDWGMGKSIDKPGESERPIVLIRRVE